jgi:hypothetical protein
VVVATGCVVIVQAEDHHSIRATLLAAAVAVLLVTRYAGTWHLPLPHHSLLCFDSAREL